MSGFLKRNNTVNPAGGVNPASSPNVGQYGWTSYDAANVNQLIQYVDMAREAANQAKESAAYVQSKFGELESFINYIEIIYEQIGPIFENIDKLYKDVVVKHQEVLNAEVQAGQAMVSAVRAASDSAQSATKSENEFNKAAAEAVKSANSAQAALISENSAANSAQAALDAAEELRKGNIYRGVWNIEAENKWPDPSGGTGEKTNSTWDVTLNEDSTEFTFAGEKWYWGDRIIYIKDEDKFQQIESGSTVISVNGKGGAVTLVPSDLGAVAVDGSSKMTGDLQTPKISLLNTETTITDSDGAVIVQSTKNFGSNLFGSDKKDTYIVYRNTLLARKGTTDYKIYHEGAKPTPADIGAAPADGARFTSGITVNGPSTHIRLIETDQAPEKHWSIEAADGNLRLTETGVAQRMTLKAGGGISISGEIFNDGEIKSKSSNSYRMSDGSIGIFWRKDGNDLYLMRTEDGQAASGSYSSHRPMHMKLATGDMTFGHKVNVRGNLWTNNTNAQFGTGADGSTYGSNSIRNQMTNCIEIANPANADHNSGAGVVFHNRSSGTGGLVYKQEGAGNAYFNFVSDETHWDVRVNGNSLYHQGFKPTANDVGALPATQGVGYYQVDHTVYFKTGAVVQNRSKTNSISIETPENGDPYIAAKTSTGGVTYKAIQFGHTEISVEGEKRFASNTFRVAHNAGLKFSANPTLQGVSWGMGIDNSSGILGMHRYQDGVWVGAPMEFHPSGGTMFPENVHSNGALISRGGVLIAERAANPMVELHSPGIAAGMMYLPGNSRLRFANSNGAGGEVNWYADMRPNSTIFPRRIEPTTNSTHWGSRDDNVGGLMDHTPARYVVVGEWHPMITSSTYIHSSQGYATTWSLGHFRHIDHNNGQVVLNMIGDGTLSNNQRFYFGAQGNFGVEGTHNGHWWSLSDGGYLNGNIFGGYGNMVNWCTGSFAPASDAKLKTILGESTKSALDVVNRFSFKKFAWNEEAGEVYTTRSKKVTEIGLIAQEVEAIDPCLVKDIKIEGTNSTELKSLDTASMLALALKAIQEQQVQIDELKEKLNEFILK